VRKYFDLKEKRMNEERRIIKFVFEQHTRLSCILRFSNTPRLSSENVAEHSYYVTFLAMLLGDYLLRKGIELNMVKLLKMSMLHDVEEIISGDIIKILKSGGFKDELDKMNVKSMEFLTGVLGENGKIYFHLWHEAKEKETLEAKVVDLVDMIACVIYSLKEVHLGNEYFKEILGYAVEKILAFSGKIPGIKSFVRELANYVLNYLQKDKEISDAINKAVRIYDYGDQDENK